MKVSLLILATLAIASAEPPVPSSQYLPGNQYSAPSNQYGAPRPSSGRPSTGYRAPSSFGQTSAVIRPNAQYGAPSTGSQYLAPSAPSSQYGAPSSLNSQYGAPSSLSSQYGAPGGGYAGGRNSGYDEQSEPANYNFEYHVEDAASGNDFGHQESRQGDVAQGRYFVLLPDGRRQVVEYTADNEGYKPKISYEQVGGGYGGAGGYSGGGYAGGAGGYSGGAGGYSGGNSGGAGGYSGGNSGGGNGGYQY